MKKFILLLILLALLAVPVSAMEFTAPEVPESAEEYMPPQPDSFGEGLWYIIKKAIAALQPSMAEAAGICLGLISISLLVGLTQSLTGGAKQVAVLVGTVSIGLLLMRSASAMINLGTQTVTELSEYGKLLLPVMTAALAAQGGVTSSTALYAGTALFDSVLTGIISKLLVPLVYVYLCLSIASSALGEELLKKLRDFVCWVISWSLKILLYVFTGYIGITGVVSGTADASAVKAAKLAISGAVPVVGGILSDASEAILVSAGVMKSAAGVYGLLAIIAVGVGPFLKVGIQYLLLKITAAISDVTGSKATTGLVQDFSKAMGLVLAMIGTVCLLLLISTVCFMKGVS